LCDRCESVVKQFTFEESQDVGALIAILKSKAGSSRLSAIRALGEIGPHARDAVPQLVELLRGSDVETAFGIMDALRKIGNWADSAFPVLVQLLGDKRDMIRGMAAKFLAEIARSEFLEGKPN
jgi:HEAT repeat protein